MDLCSLETAHTNAAMFKRAMTTYQRRYGEGVAEDVEVPVLSHHGLIAARLGQADDFRKYVYNQITNPYNDYCDWESIGPPMVLSNRMTMREGPGSISAQRLGNAAHALTEALMQSLPGSPAGEPFCGVGVKSIKFAA